MASDTFVQQLPSLPAVAYTMFADVVHESGFPITWHRDARILPELTCPAISGDDSTWAGAPIGPETQNQRPVDNARMVWERPAILRAGDALTLHFRVERDGAPATDSRAVHGHGRARRIVRSDVAVFAHIHPIGSVAMPALALAAIRTPATSWATRRCRRSCRSRTAFRSRHVPDLRAGQTCGPRRDRRIRRGHRAAAVESGRALVVPSLAWVAAACSSSQPPYACTGTASERVQSPAELRDKPQPATHFDTIDRPWPSTLRSTQLRATCRRHFPSRFAGPAARSS